MPSESDDFYSFRNLASMGEKTGMLYSSALKQIDHRTMNYFR